MADSYSSESYWQKRALEVQRNAPVRVQGELFQQQQRREQTQAASSEQQTRAPAQGQPWRPTLVQ